MEHILGYIYIYYRLLSLDTLVGKLRPLRAPLSILIDGPFDHFRLRGWCRKPFLVEWLQLSQHIHHPGPRIFFEVYITTELDVVGFGINKLYCQISETILLLGSSWLLFWYILNFEGADSHRHIPAVCCLAEIVTVIHKDTMASSWSGGSSPLDWLWGLTIQL